VDLVPFKTCSYDCIYCQLGRTTCKTTERKEWVPLDDVLLELKDALATRPDYITLSGSGEPTLHARLGEVVDRIKSMTNVPLAVLTNGSLLWDEDVRQQLHGADLVVPSLDAGNESTFQQVNRPHETISFEKLLDGLIAFRREFPGKYWLEVLLVADLSATQPEVAQMAEHVDRIRPDRVQLNTVTRPPAERHAAPVPRDLLTQLASVFRPTAEIIAEFHATQAQAVSAASRDRVVTLLERRPCTLDEIAQAVGMHRGEVVKYIEYLNTQGRLRQTHVQGHLYYQTAR
jgi:wyosine [tRNA(Phe)-imidazoG37] synthetase (radical SAM superfamily)